MLAERRPALSFVSTNLPADKENAFLANRHSHSRPRSAHSRRRCARTVVSNSHLLAAAASTCPARPRHRPSRLTPYNVHMATNGHPLPSSSSQTRLRLPRQLPRPRFHPIDVRAVVAVDPVLADIPLSYIQHSLQEMGPRLLHATRSTTATPPTNQLPRQLRLVCNDISVEPPSHIIAAYTNANPRITLFPMHALVLVTSCAHLPTLPVSRPDTPATPGGAVTLPVIPLRLPSPASFPILVSYLYTKRADSLLAELLPVRNPSSITQLARAHAAAFPVNVLIANIHKVHGLWNNVSALGIFDDQLLRALELAWEVLLDALAISTGQSVEAGITLDEELE